jgi:hypothetical protein
MQKDLLSGHLLNFFFKKLKTHKIFSGLQETDKLLTDSFWSFDSFHCARGCHWLTGVDMATPTFTFFPFFDWARNYSNYFIDYNQSSSLTQQQQQQLEQMSLPFGIHAGRQQPEEIGLRFVPVSRLRFRTQQTPPRRDKSGQSRHRTPPSSSEPVRPFETRAGNFFAAWPGVRFLPFFFFFFFKLWNALFNLVALYPTRCIVEKKCGTPECSYGRYVTLTGRCPRRHELRPRSWFDSEISPKLFRLYTLPS